MTIKDGFNLWMGKAIFDFAIFFGIIAVGIFGVLLVTGVARAYRAIRRSLGK